MVFEEAETVTPGELPLMSRLGLDEATRSMEGLLPKRIEGKVRLKNGSEVDAQPAYVWWRMLEALDRVKPAVARDLLSLARGEHWLVSHESAQRLRNDKRAWFDQQGQLDPIAKDVLLSAWRDTADGRVIVNPFQLASQNEIDLLAIVERQDSRFLRDLFRRGGSAFGPNIS